MTARGLLDTLDSLGVLVTAVAGKLRLDPLELVPLELVPELKAHKFQILALLEMPKPSTIWEFADLELAPIICTLTEPAYLSLECGGMLCLLHKIIPAAAQADHLDQARAKLERKYAGAVPPINTITLEQQSSTLGRVSVALERPAPICKACVFWKSFNGASRACGKKNLETHGFFLCDVAGPRGEGLMFKAVGA